MIKSATIRAVRSLLLAMNGDLYIILISQKIHRVGFFTTASGLNEINTSYLTFIIPDTEIAMQSFLNLVMMQFRTYIKINN